MMDDLEQNLLYRPIFYLFFYFFGVCLVEWDFIPADHGWVSNNEVTLHVSHEDL